MAESAVKLVRIIEDIPCEDSFDDKSTWYGFESVIRITKKANFAWQDNTYGDRNFCMTSKLKNLIKKKLIPTGKPALYNFIHDWYEVEHFSLAETEACVAMSPIIAVVQCGGGFSQSEWCNEFIIVRPEDVKMLESILNEK